MSDPTPSFSYFLFEWVIHTGDQTRRDYRIPTKGKRTVWQLQRQISCGVALMLGNVIDRAWVADPLTTKIKGRLLQLPFCIKKGAYTQKDPGVSGRWSPRIEMVLWRALHEADYDIVRISRNIKIQKSMRHDDADHSELYAPYNIIEVEYDTTRSTYRIARSPS